MTKASDADLRKNRIPIMMSDAELAAIDKWRFANAIGSRAEAIRQLTEDGMLWRREKWTAPLFSETAPQITPNVGWIEFWKAKLVGNS